MTGQMTLLEAAREPSEAAVERWRRDRDRALERVTRSAGMAFVRKAKEFALSFLQRGAASGDEITEACKAAGIRPHSDDRAFGAVYMQLSREKRIEKCGETIRNKGHGTAGGNLWRLAGV